jgi:prepilin-type N-terminal cleavage/methylation domain-containing protein
MHMHRKGFTLIELVIVILVIGIMSLFVATDFINSVSLSKLEAARWRLKSDIGYAQALAVTQQVNHGIIFNPSAETYSLYRQDVGTIVTDPLTSSDFTVNYQTDPVLKGVEIESVNFGFPATERLEFNQLGVPSNGTSVLTNDGGVTLRYQGRTVSISVTKDTGSVN